MKYLFSKNVKPENYGFFNITQVAYIIGGSCHLALCFFFLWLKVYEMFWFNFMFSIPVFIFAFFMNRQGWHSLAFSFAFVEILFHQFAGVYYIGWDSGLQYYLIYLAGLAFFNVHWHNKVRVFFITVVFTAFFILYLFFKIPEAYILSKPIYDLFYLYCSLSTMLSLSFLIHYYVQVANNAENDLKSANMQLSDKNFQIEKALTERNQAFKSLNQELAEAAIYVKTILPQPITDGEISTDWRFVPSASLGGDAFGYHWLDEDHFSIYLIDVSGHGVGAALLSVSVINSLRSQALPDTDFKDPGQVLASLNTAFPGEENNDMFFTIWYGIYNKRTQELIYSSGGHPSALLFDNAPQDDPKGVQLRTSNHVIGGLSDVKYEKKRQFVGTDHTLYIFSDGVYEVEKSDGKMWRFKEFVDFMNTTRTDGSSCIDRLYQHAKMIGKSDHLEDDFTIVEVVFNE